jgi:hypothetical protein
MKKIEEYNSIKSVTVMGKRLGGEKYVLELFTKNGLLKRTVSDELAARVGDYGSPVLVLFADGEVDVMGKEDVDRQIAAQFIAAEFMNPDIENRFTYHRPKEGQPERYTELREKGKELAYLIDKTCPASRERSVATTKLEECIMWANASIARS